MDDAIVEMTKNEVAFLCLLIDECAKRGAFKPIEFGDIYNVYARMKAALYVDYTEPPEQEEQEEPSVEENE